MNIEIISSALIIVVAIFFGFNASNFPSASNFDLGARFMPNIYVLLLIALSVLNLVIKFNENKKQELDKVSFSKDTFKIMGIFAVYIFLIQYVGFYIMTPIFIFILLKYFRIKSIKTLVISPILFTILIYVFFKLALKVSLPMGILFG